MDTTPDSNSQSPSDRLLDRILLLQQFISPNEVLQVLEQTRCIDARRCTLSFEVTCWIVLAMGILTDMPIRAVFRACTSLHRIAKVPARSSLCEARQRLGIAPLRRLYYRIARPLARPDTPGAFYKGLRLMAIDGVVRTVPDTQANSRAFGRASAGPRGQAAFPQVRCVTLVEVGTHAQIAFAVRGICAKGGEQGMVPSLLKYVEAGMLLMWDSGFYSYRLWHQAVATGTELLVRLSGTLKLPVLKRLADGSYLSKVYRTAQDRKRDRNGTWVRVLCYTHTDPRRVLCGKEHRLLTTLLNPETHPAKELVCQYHQRWEIELVNDEQKTHQAPRMSGKEAQVRSETPGGVVQELYALSLGHYLTRAFMAEAAHEEGLDPDRLSFMGCLRILRIRLPEYAAVREEEREDWYKALLKEMAGERTESRRNRINPRVVKVKMSNFKKKRAEHRGIPSLTQTFEETVVML
jgi:hypothetical protein